MIYNFFGTHDEDIEFDKQCLKLIVGDQVYILEEFEGKLRTTDCCKYKCRYLKWHVSTEWHFVYTKCTSKKGGLVFNQMLLDIAWVMQRGLERRIIFASPSTGSFFENYTQYKSNKLVNLDQFCSLGLAILLLPFPLIFTFYGIMSLLACTFCNYKSYSEYMWLTNNLKI